MLALKGPHARHEADELAFQLRLAHGWCRALHHSTAATSITSATVIAAALHTFTATGRALAALAALLVFPSAAQHQHAALWAYLTIAIVVALRSWDFFFTGHLFPTAAARHRCCSPPPLASAAVQRHSAAMPMLLLTRKRRCR